jgi:hypothetical protein
MGFVLSALYFITYYLTPTTIFGPLAVYRVELILAVLVFFVSLPARRGAVGVPFVYSKCLCILPCVSALQLQEEVAGSCLDDAICLPVCDCAGIYRVATRITDEH